MKSGFGSRAVGPDAVADTGSLSCFPHRPQQSTSVCKAASACQEKSMKARGKNASGSVGLLKHSCTSELGKSTALRKVPGEQRNFGVTFGRVSGLPLSIHFYWLKLR